VFSFAEVNENLKDKEQHALNVGYLVVENLEISLRLGESGSRECAEKGGTGGPIEALYIPSQRARASQTSS